jgi:excisionase family DNA binding protein
MVLRGDAMASNDMGRTMSVAEAAEILGIGRNAAYEAVKTGQIPAIKIGKRILVPRAALDRLLAGNS